MISMDTSGIPHADDAASGRTDFSAAIALSRLHFPVENLGHGRRIGVWLQGCTVRCRGCVSRDTWPVEPEHLSNVESVIEWISARIGQADGVTVSGGEPTDQPLALAALLDGIRRLADFTDDHDILVFSGRSLPEAHSRVPALRDLADAVITEPFIRELASDTCGLRGSSNQIVTPQTELGAVRYAPDAVDGRYGRQRRQMGVHVDKSDVWLVGIPQRGLLAELESDLAADGVSLGRKSWLA